MMRNTATAAADRRYVLYRKAEFARLTFRVPLFFHRGGGRISAESPPALAVVFVLVFVVTDKTLLSTRMVFPL